MDLRDIDLNLLKALDALLAERHVTRAAQLIGISQPAMSAALARLRRLTNDELLVRSARGLAPTPYAAELEAPVRDALATIADALGLRRRFDPLTERRVFRVAMADLPAQLLAPSLVRALTRTAPNTDLRVRAFRDRRDAVALLDDGEVDAAIGVSPGQEARILHQPLLEQAFVGIAADAADAQRCRDLDAFCAAKHVLVSPEGDDFGAVDAALERIGRHRRIVTTVATMQLAPQIVATTDLVAALPQDMVATSPFRDRLTLFALPVAIDPVTFHLLWHRRSHDHPAQRWFRETISAAAA